MRAGGIAVPSAQIQASREMNSRLPSWLTPIIFFALKLLDSNYSLNRMAETKKKAFLIEVVDVVRLYVVFLDYPLQLSSRK